MNRFGSCKNEREKRVNWEGNGGNAVPKTVVGFALAATLMVQLLLIQAQLSQLGFAISALEQERAELESLRGKLTVTRAKLYGADRVERYATQELGMVKPNPDQIYCIEIFSDVQETSEEN